MGKNDFNVTLGDVSKQFVRKDAFIRGILGPVGSGKSSVCCFEIMKRACNMPPGRDGIRKSRWVAIRGTYQQLMDTTLKTWLEWFPEETYGKFNKNDMTHYVRFKNSTDNSEVHLDLLFRALDKPQDQAKLKSLELTGGWMNEAVELPLEILEMLETRVGRYPAKRQVKEYWSGIIMDTNPPDTDHWWFTLAEKFVPKMKSIYKREWPSYGAVLDQLVKLSDGLLDFSHVDNEEEAQEECDTVLKKYAFFRQPSGLSKDAENVDNLPRGYYQRAVVGKSQEWVKVFIHGEYGFVADGKPVYPEYRDSTHFNPTLLGPDEENKTIIRGWDGGRTPACVFLQITNSGRVQVFDELCGEDTGVSEFADRVNRHCAENYPEHRFVDYGDPSIFYKSQIDDQSLRHILKAKGIQLQGGIQSPKIRKEAVKKILNEMRDGQPTLQIGPKAEMLRKGVMGGYCFKRVQTSGERYHEKADKGKFSHVVEAFEYPCTRMFGMAVIDEEFDYEEARNEWAPRDNSDIIAQAGRSTITGY